MAHEIKLNAKPRTEVGKTSKRLSREGLVPAILYGHNREAIPLSVERHEFEMMLQHGGGAAMVKLAIEGEKAPVDVIVKDTKHSPAKGTLQHVDFYAVRMDEALHAAVALHYIGEEDSVGVRSGGILMHNLREVNIEAMPADLPEYIEADVSALDVGDSLHISELTLPKGVKILDDADMIVSSVTAPRVELEVAPSEEEAEPEVIGEKSSSEE